MLKKKGQKNNLGFSLVEIIIVTAIVTLSFMGIMSLVRRTIMLRSINQDNLIAGQLAAEGIELVKNVRNENWLQQSALGFTGKINANNSVPNCAFSSTRTLPCDYFIIDYLSRPGWEVGDNLIPVESGLENIKFTKETSLGTIGLIGTDLKGEVTKLNLVTYEDGRTFYSYFDESDDENIVSIQPTIFHRIIRSVLHRDYGGEGIDMLEVQSRVYWQNRGKDNEYTLNAELYDYDWYY
ncbi:MAG: hypothetical protein V1865_00720 [bacterium]